MNCKTFIRVNLYTASIRCRSNVQRKTTRLKITLLVNSHRQTNHQIIRFYVHYQQVKFVREDEEIMCRGEGEERVCMYANELHISGSWGTQDVFLSYAVILKLCIYWSIEIQRTLTLVVRYSSLATTSSCWSWGRCSVSFIYILLCIYFPIYTFYILFNLLYPSVAM